MIAFFAEGTPAPKGSFRVFAGKRRSKRGKLVPIVLADSDKTLTWEATVRATANALTRGWKLWRPLEGPIAVTLTFHLARPKSVSAKKRPKPDVKPDIDKFARSTLDALAGIAYVDDAQVTELLARKRYAEPGGRVGCYVQVDTSSDR